MARTLAILALAAGAVPPVAAQRRVRPGGAQSGLPAEWSAFLGAFDAYAREDGVVGGRVTVVRGSRVLAELKAAATNGLSIRLTTFSYIDQNPNGPDFTLGTVTEVDNVVVTGVTRNDGKAFQATIPTAYVEIGNIELAEAKESTLEVTFMGLYTLTDPKKLPGYLEIAV